MYHPMKTRKKISVTEAAAAMSVSRQYVLQLLAQRRIKGAEQVGADGRWAIPATIVILPSKRPRGRPKTRAN